MDLTIPQAMLMSKACLERRKQTTAATATAVSAGIGIAFAKNQKSELERISKWAAEEE